MLFGRVRVGARLRDRLVGERHLPDLVRMTHVRAGEIEHRRGGIGRDDPLTGVNQMSGQPAAPAPELDDETWSTPGQGADGTRRYSTALL